MYITPDYYLNDFKGIEIDNLKKLSEYIKKASETIDMITGYRIAKGEVDLSKTHPFIKSQVEKATAAMTEYYVVNGYDSQIQQGAESVSLGSFNYSMRSNSGKKFEAPVQVISLLSQTGLLYSGILTEGGGVFYDR